MKVFYIGSGFDGCYYARCLVPMVAGGWDGEMVSLRSPRASKENMLYGAMAADVVVFQRPMQRERTAAAIKLKLAGKKVVMDNDDTYSEMGGTLRSIMGKSEVEMEMRREQINRDLMEFLEVADLVTVTTEKLREEYLPFNRNVVVLPNCVDPDDWSTPKRNETGKVRIGFVGSVTHDQDYEPIREFIGELSKDSRVQLVVFGLPPKNSGNERVEAVFAEQSEFWLSMNVEWQPIVGIGDYMDTLNNLRLDLMLIPRTDDYFNRCKSNIKFLEASMCEIPVVAQGFSTGDSPYQGKADARHMAIATTLYDWETKVYDLINHPEKRTAMGKKARRYVLESYAIEGKIPLWEEAYKSLFV